MQTDEFHIGKLIREKMKEQGYPVIWLAEKIPCCRTNIYKILNRPNIDTDVLMKISLALDTNFFQYLTENYVINKGNHPKLIK
jgi:hypothetical protein